jgi:hypothetical protein
MISAKLAKNPIQLVPRVLLESGMKTPVFMDEGV